MFKIVINYDNGISEEEDDEFETREEAESYAQYLEGCAKQGAEILNMSNPGDYEYDENADYSFDYDIIEK